MRNPDNNRNGVLGNDNKPELNKYLSDKYIIDICCGSHHSLALTDSGEVYAWGRNYDGQVGNGRGGKYKYQLKPVKGNGFNGEKVTMISCGSRHSMALTSSGRVFSWGCNKCGQLGINNINNMDVPCFVTLRYKTPIKKISCGEEHSLLLSSYGEIYWFGNNGIEELITPIKLIHTNIFIDIASNPFHKISFAHSINGIYYAWGKCQEEVIKEPKMKIFKSFNDVFAYYLQITHKTFESNSSSSKEFIPNGKYKKEFLESSEIGSGSYGKVFKVENNLTHEISAIKKIPVIDENKSFKELITSFIISE